MHKLVFVTLAIGAFGLMANQAEAQSKRGAWCEANCRKLCQLTSRNPSACYARIPCGDFKGKECAPDARVNARARSYCAQYPQQCP